jgi:hypothetical protein
MPNLESRQVNLNLKPADSRLKLHAWIYQTFGIFTKYAEKRQEADIKKVISNPTPQEYGMAVFAWRFAYKFYKKHGNVGRLTNT